MSPGAPYHHFPDETALLAEVAREGFEALGEEQAAAHGPDPGARLAAMTAAYVRFAGAHATHYAVMFAMLPDRVEGPGAAALRAAAKTTFAPLAAAISAANPDLTPPQAHRRALHAWAHAHGAVSVGGLATGLEPAFDPETFAAEVGESVRALAEAPALTAR
ncbi:MAG: hypothetical protein RLZZ383_2940 [Pseudomonadota bacterium]